MYLCMGVNADLEQQEAGQMTGVGGFFALEKDHVRITTVLRLISQSHFSRLKLAPSDRSVYPREHFINFSFIFVIIS